jgi:hypothetical protein
LFELFLHSPDENDLVFLVSPLTGRRVCDKPMNRAALILLPDYRLMGIFRCSHSGKPG